MLPAAQDYTSGDWNSLHVYKPARGGRSCEHFGGYKTINQITYMLPIASENTTYRIRWARFEII